MGQIQQNLVEIFLCKHILEEVEYIFPSDCPSFYKEFLHDKEHGGNYSSHVLIDLVGFNSPI